MFPLEFRGEVNHEETSHGAALWWKMHDQLFVTDPPMWQTDNKTEWQTDRQTDRRTGDGILRAIA